MAVRHLRYRLRSRRSCVAPSQELQTLIPTFATTSIHHGPLLYCRTFGKGIGLMVTLKVGDEVRWVHAVTSPEHKNAVGTITAVMPDNTAPEFTMYDVKFSFGVVALYGTQIESALDKV
jgi:hypothetical protein